MLIHDLDVEITMRDGTITRANVLRPSTGRHPTLLARGAWSKSLPHHQSAIALDPEMLALRGFAVVVQDVRGTHSSDGEFIPFLGQVEDGYDSVDWCVQQPWSNGDVGLFGRSQPGLYAWLAAASGHPAIRAIAPVISTGDTYSWIYQRGVLQLGWALWFATTLARNQIGQDAKINQDAGAIRQEIAQLSQNQLAIASHIPLGRMPLLSRIAPYFDLWLSHSEELAWWPSARGNGPWAPAVLMIGGWYDIFSVDALNDLVHFSNRSTAGEAAVRLVMGPWSHNAPLRRYLGECDFGPLADEAGARVDELQTSFFSYWLQGIDDGINLAMPARLFAMQANEWQGFDRWPPAELQRRTFFLHSQGRANGRGGDGRLSEDVPGEEPPDVFLYDPCDPCPTHGGAVVMHGVVPQGPIDQRRLEDRADVLVYTSEQLRRPIAAIGASEVELWASTSALDTDFTAKLVDVCPDGRALLVADGIVRARYRDGLDAAVGVTPDAVQKYILVLNATYWVFAENHSIRLEISSSNFPKYSRNMNVLAAPERATKSRIARQVVHHSQVAASNLLLNIVPGD